MFKYQVNTDDTLLDVYRFPYEPVDSNMYIIVKGNDAVIIDPNVSEEAKNLLESNGVAHINILLTHEHFDHTSGLVWFQGNFDSTVILTEKCAERVRVERRNTPRLVSFVLSERDKQDGGHRYEDFRRNFVPYRIIADRTVGERETFELIGYNFTYYYTPGHSPASCCIDMNGDVVWTGDTLIRDTRTITRFKESNRSDYENIALPYLRLIKKNTTIFPGHFAPFKMQDIDINNVQF